MASPLTGEYQFGVGSLVCGYDTVAPEVSIVKISGLGPSVIAQTAPSAATAMSRTQTANRAFSPGAVVGVDTSGPRMLELDVEIFTPGDDEAAGDWWVSLVTEFDANDTRTPGSLYVWLPGIGHRELVGMPRGTSDDGLVSLPYGYVAMTLRWECTEGTLGTVVV